MTKITEREMYAMIKEIVMAADLESEKAAAITDFCDKKVDSIDARAAKAKERAAAKKAAPNPLHDALHEALTDDFQTIADLMAKVAEVDPELSRNKVAYQMGKLVSEGVAEKTEVTIPATETAKARSVVAYKAI